MTEGVLLVAHGKTRTRRLLETHADRLRRRSGVDAVGVACYGADPGERVVERCRELAEAVDVVYAVPVEMEATRSAHEALAALEGAPATVRRCEPIGRGPAVTEAAADRAAAATADPAGTTLLLVGRGSSSLPDRRGAARYAAADLGERTAHEDVVDCYLYRDPAAECIRHDVAGEVVAVPFLATFEREPEAMAAALGDGVTCAAPVGAHPRVTDAVRAEVERRRALAEAAVRRGRERDPERDPVVDSAESGALRIDGGRPPK